MRRIVAGVVSVFFHAAIGCAAFWLQDASPVYWIWQKFNFVLGGLILPLSLYPEWLQKVAYLSPFSALLNGTGRCAFGRLDRPFRSS